MLASGVAAHRPSGCLREAERGGPAHHNGRRMDMPTYKIDFVALAFMVFAAIVLAGAFC
jgi:hypothetical protein